MQPFLSGAAYHTFKQVHKPFLFLSIVFSLKLMIICDMKGLTGCAAAFTRCCCCGGGGASSVVCSSLVGSGLGLGFASSFVWCLTGF